MGTRSLTRVHEGRVKILNMYRQMDGYPSGHGKELFEFLDEMTIVNGLSLSETGAPQRIANGAGCLAAQLVHHFKHGAGGIYLEPTAATDCGQDYEYIINVVDDMGRLEVTVIGCGRKKAPLYQGDVAGFGAFCAEPESC